MTQELALEYLHDPLLGLAAHTLHGRMDHSP